jgi:hypothetical protein
VLLFGLVVTGGSIFVQTAVSIEPFLNGFILVGVGLVVGIVVPGIAVSVSIFVVQTIVLTWLTRVIYRRNRQSASGSFGNRRFP